MRPATCAPSLDRPPDRPSLLGEDVVAVGEAPLGGELALPHHQLAPEVADLFLALVDALGLDRDDPPLAVGGLLLVEHPGDHHRSEEHTSELQSRENLVCRLLLEKKKKI